MTIVYKKNIESETLKNTFYRKVLFTTPQQQLVVMSIPSGQDIGLETHPTTTQFIRVESGTGIAKVSGKKYFLKDGYCIVIPPNTKHNIITTSDEPLKIYTIYSPPEHPKGTKMKNKPKNAT